MVAPSGTAILMPSLRSPPGLAPKLPITRPRTGQRKATPLRAGSRLGLLGRRAVGLTIAAVSIGGSDLWDGSEPAGRGARRAFEPAGRRRHGLGAQRRRPAAARPAGGRAPWRRRPPAPRPAGPARPGAASRNDQPLADAEARIRPSGRSRTPAPCGSPCSAGDGVQRLARIDDVGAGRRGRRRGAASAAAARATLACGEIARRCGCAGTGPIG